MEWKNYNLDMEHNILMKIREGMKVYDSQNHEIGQVDDVFLGSVTPKEEDAGEGPATTGTVIPGTNTQTPNPLASGDQRDFKDRDTPNFAFGGAVNPTDAEESEKDRILENRMLRDGYVKIDSKGLFKKDVIVLPGQIDSVQEDSVRLKVPDKELTTL